MSQDPAVPSTSSRPEIHETGEHYANEMMENSRSGEERSVDDGSGPCNMSDGAMAPPIDTENGNVEMTVGSSSLSTLPFHDGSVNAHVDENEHVQDVRMPTSLFCIAQQPVLDTLPMNDLGIMNVHCLFCDALHWDDEHVSSSRRNHPEFEACCAHGKVQLPLLHVPPSQV
ncbi:hypothetical protein BYT27DRAFT_7255789 [Phlegmacium glaucopus]|nr:hypothetical protein BYT27DRAFT_7255789 [Phlegmacium glaucopus]